MHYYKNPDVCRYRNKKLKSLKDKSQRGVVDLRQYRAEDYNDKDRPYSFCLRPIENSELKRVFICAGASQEGKKKKSFF